MTNAPYDRITAAILTALEGDLPAWRRPWRSLRQNGVATVPVNAVSGRAYRGINAAILWTRQDADMRYVTYRQAQQLGGHVRAGEHGTQIVFWKKKTYRVAAPEGDDDDTQERSSLLMRLYTVFNVSQCEGLKLKEPTPPADAPVAMSEVYSALAANVRHGGDQAYYAPGPDTVVMPPVDAFTSADGYAATALHELSHWTAHKTRLDRDLTGRFGTRSYAAEELVAELSSAFLSAQLGVDMMLEHHASYIESWRGLLKDDPRAVITAASKAQAAADYILERVRPAAAIDEEEEALAA